MCVLLSGNDVFNEREINRALCVSGSTLSLATLLADPLLVGLRALIDQSDSRSEPKKFHSRVKTVLLCAALVFQIHEVSAQTGSRWRVFKTSDGLDDSLCTAVTVSQRTNVWISHFQNGFVTGYDGYSAQKAVAPGIGPFRIYETPGGQMWATSNDGVQELRDQRWVDYPITEIRSLVSTNSLAPLRQVSLFPIKQGHVLIALPDRLIEFSNEQVPKTTLLRLGSTTALQRFSDLAPARDGGVWVAGAKGLGRIRGPLRNIAPDVTLEELIPPADLGLFNFQRPFEDDEGGITMVAESTFDEKRVVVYFDGQHWTVHRLREKVRLAWRDSEKTLWAMTSTSLLQRQQGSDEFIEDQEVSVSQCFDAALDYSGGFWVATSEGLFRHAALPWRTPFAVKPISGRVHAMVDDNEGRLWIASNSGLHRLDGQKLQFFPYPETLEKSFQASDALWMLPQNRLVMNADGRLLQFDIDANTFTFLLDPTGATRKVLGWLKPGVLCVHVLRAGGTQELQTFDGQKFSLLVDLPNDANFGTEIISCLSAQNGALWVGTSTGVAVYHNNVWKMFSRIEGVAPDAAFCLMETADNKIWCGGNERIWEFNGTLWVVLRGGFDRVNRIIKSASGSAWVASNNGIRGLIKEDWLLNSVTEGLPNAAVITVFEDRKKRIWAGTAHGVSLYEPAADLDPPHTWVDQLENQKNNLPENTVSLTFQAQDRWKLTQADRLLYSYRLDEHDWTAWLPNDAVSFSELASGKHIFQVRALDRNGNIDPKPAVLDFTIILPWYQETRLVLIALTGCAVALFFAVLAYNRHRKLVRSYSEIEKIVALRTQQLEKANQELLHSQKMTALGTLSAGIAHDFNNILSIIKGSAQIIETNLEDRDKIQTRLNRIKTVVEQGSGIVKAMLGFSRGSEKHLAPCNINTVVEDTIKLLGDRFLREVQIDFERKVDLPAVPASKDFIQQILLNFIFNAADALDGAGKVLLRTGKTAQLSDYIALQPARATEYLFISVEDSAGGIPPETMARIFEPFFTTKAFSARRGTGLGLSMVYELAKEMGCGLAVKSEVGKGSVFMLLLPLLPERESRS
ncbi:MAG: Histidine kinase [Verrucomicrobiales bacterium]|nr:Histidine kinase [Verrucomicrobiales bacterium]